MKLSFNAPAKINWFLNVVNKRDDGYHNILSAMQCVDLFDELHFENADRIELHTDLDLPVEENLVYKAAILIKDYSSFKHGARIRLRKKIPAAAGLGGGSSDAATTLFGLNRLWKLNLGTKALMELAAQIGSDVPFFLGGPFSIVEGRGNIVNDIKLKNSVTMLLVKPDISISATWAYGKYKTELTKKHIDIKLFCQNLDKIDLYSLRPMVFNDLETSVVKEYKIIEDIKKALIENEAVISCMSGSGPSVFGVFNSHEQAFKASENMGENWCMVVKTLI